MGIAEKNQESPVSSGKRFTYPFRYDPAPEIRAAANEISSHINNSGKLKEAFSDGKMLGVLIVSWDSDAELDGDVFKHIHRLANSQDNGKQYGYLAAFSGLAGGKNTLEGFVPPIFDLLDPDGLFKIEEARISEINRQIETLTESEGSGSASVQALKVKRKSMSDDLQKWIFSRFVVYNGLGEQKSILDIFAEKGLVPPGGTGECAAPKLLQYAFANGLAPVSMGEFWYESAHSAKTHSRVHGQFYPSCSSKCGPLLRWMLHGIDVDTPYGFNDGWTPDIIWEDGYMMAVAKPAGMLCVPGKDGQTSLMERLQQPAYSVHRLDMDTSGVLLVAKTLRVQKELQRQFENREISKTYIAIVENASGALKTGDQGSVDLPMRLDVDDRPRQIVDYIYGKPASTGYEVLGTDGSKGLAMVRFSPRTGRTHQIRVHSSHPSGLGSPIAGDLLYGGRYCRRMYLHAESITFRHPMTGEEMSLTCQAGFGLSDAGEPHGPEE